MILAPLGNLLRSAFFSADARRADADGDQGSQQRFALLLQNLAAADNDTRKAAAPEAAAPPEPKVHVDSDEQTPELTRETALPDGANLETATLIGPPVAATAEPVAVPPELQSQPVEYSEQGRALLQLVERVALQLHQAQVNNLSSFTLAPDVGVLAGSTIRLTEQGGRLEVQIRAQNAALQRALREDSREARGLREELMRMGYSDVTLSVEVDEA